MMRRSLRSNAVGAATALLAIAACLAIPAAAQVVWEENFDGPTLDRSTWTFDVGGSGFGNAELQYYTARPENVYIDNGSLVIQGRREVYSGKQFTSARLKSHGRFAFKYGTLEARIRIPDLENGLWPAFWLLGDDIGQVSWPDCGEIDILEMGMEAAIQAGVVNQRVSAAGHWDYFGSYAQYGSYITMPIELNLDYHTYKLEWTPTQLSARLDNIPYWTLNISDIAANSMEEFHTPHFIILNLAVGGINFVNITDPNLITAPFPAQLYVDWIRLTDNGYTEIYPAADTAETGNFGIFTETTPVNDTVHYGTDSELYIWNNMTSTTGTPQEGSEVWSFNVAAANWFGMGVFCLHDRNMMNYSDGQLHFHMKTTSPHTFGIGIASSSAGEGWVNLAATGENFGLVRDGQWHEVVIPLSRLASNVDFNTIKQIFMFKGEGPAAAFNVQIDNVYWSPSGPKPTPEHGNFGVFTDDPAHKTAGNFTLGLDGQFYVWENTLVPRTSTPFEGANSLGFGSTPGYNWFGAAFTPTVKYDLTAFRYPDSKLHVALKTNSPVIFQIGMKSGTVNDIGQQWIKFAPGSDPYGFVRDGNWHAVEIPMNAFSGAVDLADVAQLFELLGVDGPITTQLDLDDICFLNGGAAEGGEDVLPGDLNCDSVVDFADINPFVMRLIDEAAYEALFPDCPVGNADVSGNGTVGFEDINPFVTLLLQP